MPFLLRNCLLPNELNMFLMEDEKSWANYLGSIRNGPLDFHVQATHFFLTFQTKAPLFLRETTGEA